MAEKALITGINGFVGSHLAEHLLGVGVDVYGIKKPGTSIENIQHIVEDLVLVEADMLDQESLESALKETEPDYMFHLAAQSYVPESWNAPAKTLETNAVGTIYLLEAVRASGLKPRIQVAGSSEEYGLIGPEELPVTEDNPLRPLSPYGVSKVAQDLVAWQYHRSYGMHIVRTRAFNHTGPRGGELFVASNFAKQIALIENGSSEPIIRVGNLDAQRDFLDVRDVVRAYRLSLAKCRAGEAYNICSGTARTIGSVLDLLLSLSKRSDIRVEQDPARMRPSDVGIIRGNCDLFRKETGWEPEIPFEKTMEDLLDHWRSVCGR